MRTVEVDQGSLEWMQTRLGIPTASKYDQLLTPKTRKPSAAAKTYRAELIAEWLLGQPLDWGTTAWMERGTSLEDEAAKFYAFEHGVEVVKTGVIMRDDGQTGGSPDRLVGSDGGLEIKCPGAAQHVKYMLDIEDIAEKHIGQVQGYMYLTGRTWWDVLSYNPELPPVIKRVERDQDYIDLLVPILDAFIEQLNEDKERFAAHRVLRPWDPEIQAELRRAS